MRQGYRIVCLGRSCRINLFTKCVATLKRITLDFGLDAFVMSQVDP